MEKVFIVQRVEPLTGQKYAKASELRAYATAEGASDKIKQIYDRLLSVWPSEFHDQIKLVKYEKSGLYRSVTSEDGTKWSVVEVEIRN